MPPAEAPKATIGKGLGRRASEDPSSEEIFFAGDFGLLPGRDDGVFFKDESHKMDWQQGYVLNNNFTKSLAGICNSKKLPVKLYKPVTQASMEQTHPLVFIGNIF